MEGLTDLCEGLICIRKQNGSAVVIALTSVLFTERTNTQLEKILRDYSRTIFIYLTVLSTARDKKTFRIDQATLREMDGVSDLLSFLV